MQFILNDPKEFQGFFGLRVIINSQFINIPNFLIKAFLARAYIPDALKNFVKIVGRL